jgi:hypothetical protein
MALAPFDLIADLAEDPGHSWSIGRFGAIGEFHRDAGEPILMTRTADTFEISTPRGAMRIAPGAPLTGIAWESLSTDGDTWSPALAFCRETTSSSPEVVTPLGPDGDAVRPEDRGQALYDLGVGLGAVRMAIRTRDPSLIAALDQARGQALFSSGALAAEILRAQPHRVLLSPAGRIEVFQPIPGQDGKSPEGPHTHLLPKLFAERRMHSANTPLPDGLQGMLTAHPKSPWRDGLGRRHAFDEAADNAFATLQEEFGSDEDAEVRQWIITAVRAGTPPSADLWPATRHGRTVARIALRRLAAAGDERVNPWRIMWDRTPVEQRATSSSSLLCRRHRHGSRRRR